MGFVGIIKFSGFVIGVPELQMAFCSFAKTQRHGRAVEKTSNHDGEKGDVR
jgi:hypothetical protein